jgi:ParB-like chromosome segregation protein Spo0J
VSKYEIHPTAALFPELDTDEMATLVESIRAIGLQHPISLVGGRIVDGRSREEACELAGVEPVYETLSLSEDKVSSWRRMSPAGI